MSRISDLLQQIMDAVYGKDVRGAIHDSIEECYTNTNTGKTIAETAADSANTAASAANTAAANANAAKDAANAAAASAGDALDYVATVENDSPASNEHAKGSYIIYDGTLYEVINPISIGDILTVGTNITAVPEGLGSEVTKLKSAFEEADIATLIDYPTERGYVTTQNKWGSINNNALTVFFPVSPGDAVEITGNATNNTVVCVLTEYPTITSGGTPPFSTDSNWTSRKIIGDTTKTYTMPSDAAYLAITAKISGNSTLPQFLYVNRIEYANSVRKDIADNEQALDALEARFDRETLTIATCPYARGYVGTLNKWASIIDTTLTAFFPVSPGDVVQIIGNATNNTVVCVFTEYPAIVSGGDPPFSADSAFSERIGIGNAIKTYTMPADAAYLAFTLKITGNDTTPQMLRVNGIDYTKRPNAPFGRMSGQAAVLELTGDINAMTKDDAVTLNYAIFGQTGTCTCKWQGSSSVRYPKKNYTLKFDTAFDARAAWATYVNSVRTRNGNVSTISTASRWGSQKKYCAKSNWVDASHARNIVCARLWAQIVQDRIADGEITDGRTNAPNYGAIDGFPLEIRINGVSMGLYTMNIPKDPWQFAMGAETTEYLVTSESSILDQCKWLAEPVFGEVTQGSLTDTDFEVEYAPDGVTDETVENSFKAAVNAAISASGASWQTAMANYVDIGSAIDYYIFACCINHSDGMPHNIIYGTYNGTKWFFSAYDLDTTFGMDAYGSGWDEVWPTANVNARRCRFQYGAAQHKLFNLLYTYNKAELKARYQELRGGILSDENVWKTLSDFMINIPSHDLNVDRTIWTGVPGTNLDTISQYMDFYRMHCKKLDEEVASWQI